MSLFLNFSMMLKVFWKNKNCLNIPVKSENIYLISKNSTKNFKN